MSQNGKQEIKHPDRPDTSKAPYSSAVLCDGWLYVSGQGPIDLKTMQIVGNGIEEQTRVTLENIRQLLEAGGASFADVVKCNCWLDTIDDFDAFTKTYLEYFQGTIKPARSTVQSKLWGGILVEIDCVARVPQNKVSDAELTS